jgi:hypothetical protein
VGRKVPRDLKHQLVCRLSEMDHFGTHWVVRRAALGFRVRFGNVCGCYPCEGLETNGDLEVRDRTKKRASVDNEQSLRVDGKCPIQLV